MDDRLRNLGFSEQFMKEAALWPGLFLGRVSSQHKDLYRVIGAKGEVQAEISGKLRHGASNGPDYPAVGDFVMMDREDDSGGNAIIHQVLKRKSVFVRTAAGTGHEVQVVAANVDTVFICMSLNNDYNVRRLERYLAIIWDSGAIPVVVLTKADLCADLPDKLLEIEKIAMGVEVLSTSSVSDEGIGDVRKYLGWGQTVAFVGSSGVGKSTLINHILGEDLIDTREIRSDGKGRHTTTSRQLIPVPSGGAVIDTPGMREIGVESVDLGKTFLEIEALAENCRFNDCIHENEPGCAVRKAIEEGLLDENRLISYKKLKKEAKYDGLNSRQIEKEKIEDMFSDFGGIKNARDFVKSKNRRDEK